MNDSELRELDDLITERVMGWEKWQEPLYPYRAGWSLASDTCISEDMPKWSTDPAAAMEVLKKCQSKLAFGCTIQQVPSGWAIQAAINGMYSCTFGTLEQAICVFAKKLFTK